MVSYKATLTRVREIVEKHHKGECPHCGGTLSPRHQCYGCKRYVYDGEYWGMIERELGVK